MNFNRKTFFEGFREKFGHLSQAQVEGLEFLLGKLESDDWTLTQMAYVLATVDHESAHTFHPIKEFRARVGSKGRANQDRYWLTGFYGRGYVQITWKRNYEKFGIAENPDKALEPDTAYEVLSRGMREGLFTGHKLERYINGQTDYVNARRVVNGTDKAELIAKNAIKFETILDQAANAPVETVQSGETAQNPEPPGAPQAPKPEVTPVAPPGTSIVTKIAAGASAAGPVIAATGLKIGGVEFKTGGLIAFAAVLIVGMIVSAWLWDSAQKRRHEELKLSMQNLADPNKRNVVAAGSKV